MLGIIYWNKYHEIMNFLDKVHLWWSIISANGEGLLSIVKVNQNMNDTIGLGAI